MKGYSLTELMVVMSIIGILAMMQFYGMHSANDMEKLKASQKDLIVDLRSLQNKALNGEMYGASSTHVATFNSTTQYQIDGNPPETNGTTIGVNLGNLRLFFHNPLRTDFTGTCPTYACQVGSYTTISGNVVITLTYQGKSRTVTIEGSGAKINRIYGN